MLVTDHNPNTFLRSVPSLSRRMMRWVEFLERFNYEWRYGPGKVNVADPLSRIVSHADQNGHTSRPQPLFVGHIGLTESLPQSLSLTGCDRLMLLTQGSQMLHSLKSLSSEKPSGGMEAE